MSTKTSLVEIRHDTGYDDDLVWYINIALRGKDMRAVRTVESGESVNTDLLEALEGLMDCYDAHHAIHDEKPESNWDEYDYMMIPRWRAALSLIKRARGQA